MPPKPRPPKDDPTPRDGAAAEHLGRNVLALRGARDLTQQELAKAAGIPRSTLAHIESGMANPSLHVLVALATALAIPMTELLASPRAKVRHYKRTEIHARTRAGRGATSWPLVPEPTRDALLEVLELARGGVMAGTPHLPGTREHFTCLDGSIAIIVAGERHVLRQGEVLSFPGNVAHSYQNAGDDVARGVSVVLLSTTGA